MAWRWCRLALVSVRGDHAHFETLFLSILGHFPAPLPAMAASQPGSCAGKPWPFGAAELRQSAMMVD